ncbi:ATP-binding protein [Nonomuraea sp. FMUSA5-5]|uniref:ATP-binding protein n=1 Tax=Nonomuraea composti TaxID=2720023 RepID=A0ABX1BNA3_9ACTN|nr:ATP-binding protein [Nonomuraea sp. FMUSA5-5]NJP96238.1 ATP-binding protein [Nonomuraea sp. FMUSA5-5]
MRTLIAQSFSLEDVSKLRHVVAEHAESCGLHGPRLDDFVLAVHESVVNAVEHAGGYGRFRLYTVDGVICSETRDRGAGIPEPYVNGGKRPSDSSYTGRGIYLIRRLCDAADFRTGPGGTTVLLTMRLPRRPGPDARGRMRRIRVTAPGGRPFGRFTA